MDPRNEILRDNDPRCADLEAKGYTLVGESWGARLRLNETSEMSAFTEAIHRVSTTECEIQELDQGFAAALLELEIVNNVDYPVTPATFHSLPTFESTRALWKPENKIVGAIGTGRLVGAISTSRRDEIVELDFASVLREYRGKGIGKALAAKAILAWEEQGVQIFATGGASSNEASLGTVKSLGFRVEERWRSYQPPL